MSSFIHLHNHSDFSLLEASQSIKAILNRVHSLGMKAVALTEKNNLFSMIEFYKQAKSKGIKPIIGCEITIKNQNMLNNNSMYELVLLAKNQTGYLNLMKLVSESYIGSTKGIPCINKNILRKYSKGLIATSSGINGEISSYLLRRDYKSAKTTLQEYIDIFPGNIYLELYNYGSTQDAEINYQTAELSHNYSVPLVATNNTYYTHREDMESHEILCCIGSGHNIADPARPKIISQEQYIKSTDEMIELFKDYPEAISNTLTIAEQCDVNIPMGKLFLPKFPIPSSSKQSDPNQYLKDLCDKAINNKYKNITSEITNRLKYELGIIKKMGFANYFLITQDFVKYAKDNNIPVGPGRGSAVGSLVSYLIGITGLDPLKYNLFFERFLNPDRISMPDIDIDFCIQGREKVINYIKIQYGEKSVAQIITFGSMKAKSVIRDVGRVLGMSYTEVDKIAKMIPDDLNITIKKAQKLNQDLNKLIQQDNSCKKLIEYSKKLEGLHRHASTHAAGIVIAPGPLMNYVPLFKNPITNDITTQIEMNSLEEIGLLKMDFLGLRNLTVIDKTIDMIKINYKESININDIDLLDMKVYELFSEGNTIGVFQFESRGMRNYLKKLKPKCIEDLIAMNSLYRPGPMANIPEFLDRKNNKKKINYLHPELEPILKETYGIIVYQEQVMQIGAVIGGFTLAQSDSMRVAMGKKKKDLMATFKIDFVKGAEKKGLLTELAIKIFDLLEKFAEYGFNKSHSAAYSIIAYQTAWLKTYYPAEFMACNLSSDLLNTDSIIKLLRNTKVLKINILSPNVNTSKTEFIANSQKTLIYGLAAIKNVGYKSSENLVTYREKYGPFKTIFDLCKIGSQSMNKKVLESLIKSGACDTLEGNRAQQYSLIDYALKFGQKYQEETNSTQANLFSDQTRNATYHRPPLPNHDNWDQTTILNNEKEVLGFYLSGNPMERYLDDLKACTNVGVIDLKGFYFNQYKIGGRLFDVKTLYDKKHNPWAISRLECYNGLIIELFTFSDIYIKYKDLLTNDNIVYIEGEPSKRQEEDSFKVITKRVHHISKIREKLSQVNIKFNFEINDPNIIQDLYEIANNFPGNCNLILHMINNDGELQKMKSEKIFIANDNLCIKALKDKLGNNNVWLS